MKRFFGMAPMLCVLVAGCASLPDAPPPDRTIAISGERVFPESMSSDSAGTLYHSSFGGTIYRKLPGEGTSMPWIVPDAHNRLQSGFGVLAEEARGLLWTCSNPNGFAQPPQEGAAQVLLFDLATGNLNGIYAFPDGPALCNDIAVGPQGSVWATDTVGGRILRLGPNANEFETFAESDALRGIDGIAFSEDGTLYINNIQQGLLQRVDRTADGAFAGLTTLTTSQKLSAPDALRPLSGNRFLQTESGHGTLTMVEIAGDYATITVLKDGLNSPAATTAVNGMAYVAEGKTAFLFEPTLAGHDPGTFLIHAVPLGGGE